MGSDPAFTKRMRAEGEALLRIAANLREFLSDDAPSDDPDVQGLLRDCSTLQRVGSRLANAEPFTLSDGISVR